MKDFIYLECRLRDGLGISDGLMKKTRRAVLSRDNDFALVDGRIAYTAAAVDKAFGFLKGDKSSDSTRERALVANLSEILDAALIQAVPAEKQATQKAEPTTTASEPPAVRTMNLLSAPWGVPPAVLVVERLTLNDRILMARLHEDWVQEHGFDFFHRILFPVLRDAERNNPDLFKTKLFRVRVNTSVNFIKGMTVECAHIDQDFWECTQRMPRWRGKY